MTGIMMCFMNALHTMLIFTTQKSMIDYMAWSIADNNN